MSAGIVIRLSALTAKDEYSTLRKTISGENFLRKDKSFFGAYLATGAVIHC